MKSGKGKNESSRRAFLGGSIAATLVSAALPGHAVASTEHAPGPTESTNRQDGFISAQPIWPEGLDKEMNLFVGFRAAFHAPSGARVYLRTAGCTLYRIYLNGTFHASGPARGPRGYFRQDFWEITPLLVPGVNFVCIEVAGYNINSYYILNQPSFLQAEITTDSAVLASTGGSGAPFQAQILRERIKKVQRYSFQRAFSEAYKIEPSSLTWRERADAPLDSVPCATSETRALIPRRVPYPSYWKRQPEFIAAEGEFDWSGIAPKSLADDKSIPSAARIGPRMLGYAWTDLTTIPYLELQKTKTTTNNRIDMQYTPEDSLRIGANHFKIFDFGTNLTGFFGTHVKVHSPTKLYLTFDETLINGDVDFKRLMCVNVVAYTLAPGDYTLETFEPYVLRFLKLMVLEGDSEIRGVYLREYTAPDVWAAHFSSEDAMLNDLFAAGRETYRPNAVDFFTDCPSRERAGWLSDSFFTAQAARLLTGRTTVEKCYLENYMLPKEFPNMPPGMIPSCYPADHPDSRDFEPTLALWFPIQLEEYRMRSGDDELINALRPRMLRLLDYFKPFQNEYGLLEDLQGWVFIEWSKANDYVQNVSYAANMLYAAAIAALGRLYDLPELIKQSESLQEVIRDQSYDGEFFVDNAVRQGGKLVPTRNRTETCQYYALYFKTATRERFPKLWETLHTVFGPKRRLSGAYPEIAPSNALIGSVMRLELLSRAGLTQQLVEEASQYLSYMANLTGTLWENTSNEASMNHAFQSHINVVLYRDVLGIYSLDTVNKVVEVRFTDSGLKWCEGRIPTTDGFISMRWTRTSSVITYQLDIPAGYRALVTNLSKAHVVQKVFPHGSVDFGYRIAGGYK